MRAQLVRGRHKRYLFPCVTHYYQEPIVLTEGKGLVVRDIEGREYLDFFGGILTVSLGHADEEINAKVKAQIDRLTHVSTLYPTPAIVELAEKLASIAPGELSKCFFTSSGTEANEMAILMAQMATGHSELIALRHGYSGRSHLALSLAGHSNWRPVPTQVGTVRHALSPYCYRCPCGLAYPSCNVRCARDIEELIQTTTTGRVAGMLAETIQGVGGFIVPPREYFEIAVGIVRRHGGVFICDEVQAGFGRTGGKMFGIEHYGVVPDVMTLAKGIANGFPMGATVATEQVANSWDGSVTIATFGGNPVSCTAACATIDAILERNIPQRAETLGAVLRAGLDELRRKYPASIGDVRGMGLMQAAELVTDETSGDRTPSAALTGALLEATKKRGLLIGRGGRWGNVTRIAPPMTVSAGQIDQALAVLDESFAEIGAR